MHTLGRSQKWTMREIQMWKETQNTEYFYNKIIVWHRLPYKLRPTSWYNPATPGLKIGQCLEASDLGLTPKKYETQDINVPLLH